jgi:hypothetical protein
LARPGRQGVQSRGAGLESMRVGVT